MTAIPVDQIHPNPANVRTDLGNLDELAASLRAVGLLQPLVVKKRANGGWTIVDGHRRYQAALLAGVRALPCVARRDDDGDTAVMLAAAMHKQLSPLEQADAFARLRRRGMSPATIAARTGYSAATVRGRLALLDLPAEARALIESGELSTTDATALARQVRRTGTGSARTVQRRAGWLTATHPLADAVRRACTHAEGRVVVGGVGCGQCWEDAIRGDELARRAVERAGDGEAA
ncbi:ParB/RepB/Spo0J family partition protein [Cellulosimicrobium funkei]|uniref:ParB/RepB/Spo0J family partition protein n=1 Tax=Cellulosimicrobium funkei TaxID=264251 RepID=UPI0037DC31E2